MLCSWPARGESRGHRLGAKLCAAGLRPGSARCRATAAAGGRGQSCGTPATADATDSDRRCSRGKRLFGLRDVRLCAVCAGASHLRPCAAKTRLGRFGCILYEEICCPDPCYEGKWIPLANAAFFVDGARPVTQTKMGFDAGTGFTQPDRAEYFWAQANGSGKGPAPTSPYLGEVKLQDYELVNYTEAATGKFSLFVVTPYRSIYPEQAGHAAGFSNINIGTKSMLFDSELFQITFQFRTYIPSGNPTTGLGTGHASLEPSLLLAVNLAKDTYFQGQLAEWIPLGGDPGYQGAILHYHASLNLRCGT